MESKWVEKEVNVHFMILIKKLSILKIMIILKYKAVSDFKGF